MTVQSRLKIARESLGMTQKDVARAAGVSHRTWQDYEGGANPPGGKALEALAKLGININWLLTGEGESKVGENTGVIEKSKTETNTFIDPDRLAIILEGTFSVNIDGLDDEPEEKVNEMRAWIISTAYQYFQNDESVDKKTVSNFIVALLLVLEGFKKRNISNFTPKHLSVLIEKILKLWEDMK